MNPFDIGEPVVQTRTSGTVVIALAVLLVAGCGSVPLEPAAPAGFDLNGHWLLESEIDLYGQAGRGLDSGFLGQDFPLLVSREMRIEQDARSMGIEYARGSYRDVTWGERHRGVWHVRAGWHDGSLYIYSRASDISATEIWTLSESGRQLEIRIEVRGARDQNFHRVFRRADPI